MYDSSLYLSSKEIINQSFGNCSIGALEPVPLRTDSTSYTLTNTTELLEQRQDLMLKIYQETVENHELKKSIAYLDSRISCLAQLFHNTTGIDGIEISDHQKQIYGSLMSALQTEPGHYARLLINASPKDADRLINIACSCLFQKTDRDEYLLLTLIYVILTHEIDHCGSFSNDVEALVLTKIFDAYWM